MMTGLLIAAKNRHGTVVKAATSAKKFYDDSLQPFFKERNLRPSDVADQLHLSLPNSYDGELTKISKSHSAIFTKATEKTSEALRLSNECEVMAQDAADLLSQIQDIAEGKDFGKIFEVGAAKVSQAVQELIKKAIEKAEKLQNTTLPSVAKAVPVVKMGQPANEVESARSTLETMVPFMTSRHAEASKGQETATKLLDAERKKIPADLLKGQCGILLSQADKPLATLVKINEVNAKLVKALTEKAQGLV